MIFYIQIEFIEVYEDIKEVQRIYLKDYFFQNGYSSNTRREGICPSSQGKGVYSKIKSNYEKF